MWIIHHSIGVVVFVVVQAATAGRQLEAGATVAAEATEAGGGHTASWHATTPNHAAIAQI